ncbi:hypothetical protein RB195_005995 [Necator americanus]|uniref:DUF5641 domain-containing protein n=1 Tax=Necator americanus TaxID=51031 RepID=A0ABR1BQJ1_NECAM
MQPLSAGPTTPFKAAGFYGRLIGLFKSALKKAIKRTLLPLSQFQTLLAEIEAVLSSRPLLYTSDTSSSPHVLRPIDSVSPQMELQLPSPNRNPLYIPSNRFQNVGDVVLIADKNVPRGQWPLVIITTIHRSKTNIPRSATVRTANDHELQRSINQLHPLEISAKKDSQPKKSREELHLTRIQPPRAAKRLRFALGMKQATQPHHLSPDETSSQEILSPTTVRRLLHPIEACHAYAKGNFEPLDTLTIGKQVQHNSLPVEQRCALRLAQSLSLAIHFDHTFTLSQLAARDICMVEPFIRDDYHINLLDMIVEEATIPAPSQLLYPSLQGLPIVTIVQSYRGIHGATTILGKLTSDIAEKTEMAIHHGNYRLDGANNHSVG